MYYFMQFPLRLGVRPGYSHSPSKVDLSLKRAAPFAFPQSWLGLSKPLKESYLLIPEVLLNKYMLIYNPIQNKHSAAASPVITRPIHAQQAAAHAVQS